MSRRKKLTIIIVIVLIVIIIYTSSCREYFEAELESKRTNERIDGLSSELEKMKDELEKKNKAMEAQGNQAAAVAASLQAIR